MMTLILKRNQYRSDGIFSQLQTETGQLICQTLEHAYMESSGQFSPKIPAGSYLCQKGFHRLHPDSAEFETYEVTGVTGHVGILIHPGNTQADSKGCILVGKAVCQNASGQAIAASRAAFGELMKLLGDAVAFSLKVID